MEKRHCRVVIQRAGGETLFQFVQHIPGHGMQIGQRFGADLDPDQFHQFGIGMDHALDAMGDGGGIGGEEPGIEAADAAGRRDRARNQKQSGRIGQQAGLGKRLPCAFQGRRGAIALASEAEPGFFAGLADRGDRQRARARRRDLRAALEQVVFKRFRDWRCHGNAVVGFVDPAAGKDEFAGHEHHLVVALADQNFWRGGGAIDQDQRGGVDGSTIGVMVGFFLFFVSLAHFAPAAPFPFLVCEIADYFSGLFSSNPCMRSAHCTPTTAPFTGCSNKSDRISVNGR